MRNYGICLSDSGDDDEDDEARSRAVESRTFAGVRSAFGKEYPWTIEPLKLFWGLIVIQEYVYRCVLSHAKISLMQADLPRIDSKKSKTEGHISKKDYDESVAANEAIYQRRLAAEKEAEGVEINLTDLLNGKNIITE